MMRIRVPGSPGALHGFAVAAVVAACSTHTTTTSQEAP
jgi:hypothetical protein